VLPGAGNDHVGDRGDGADVAHDTRYVGYARFGVAAGDADHGERLAAGLRHVDEVQRILERPGSGAMVRGHGEDERVRRFAGRAPGANCCRVLVVGPPVEQRQGADFERFALRPVCRERADEELQGAVRTAARPHGAVDAKDSMSHAPERTPLSRDAPRTVARYAAAVAPPRVAVLGSCTADLVLRMPRFPVAGETLFADEGGLFAGGKGLNQAIAAARLGASATLIGRVGADALGDFLLETARADGVDCRFVVRDPGHSTGVAVPIVLPDGANSILAAPGANFQVTLAQVEAARDAITAADCLLLQFEAPMEANLAAARIAAGAGRTVFLNPAPFRPFPPELMSLASILTPNEVEAVMLAPGETSDEARARTILAQSGAVAVVVTLGAAGCVVCDASGIRRFAALPVRAVDTVGAGDAFCGALAVAMASGEPLDGSVRLANAAAAVSVTRPGAAPSLPTRAEVEALLKGT